MTPNNLEFRVENRNVAEVRNFRDVSGALFNLVESLDRMKTPQNGVDVLMAQNALMELISRDYSSMCDLTTDVGEIMSETGLSNNVRVDYNFNHHEMSQQNKRLKYRTTVH